MDGTDAHTAAVAVIAHGWRLGAAALVAAALIPVSAPTGSEGGGPVGRCGPAPTDSTAYYQIALVSTKLVPGTGFAAGNAEVIFEPSPFGVNLAPDGSFHLQVHVQTSRLPAPPAGSRFVAWVTTPSVDAVRRIGPLDDGGRITGSVDWNKFLVVITLERDGADSTAWSGPVVLRGMARSGKMHTMAGHGPYEQERCANYGY